jgi:hypothetical protein
MPANLKRASEIPLPPSPINEVTIREVGIIFYTLEVWTTSGVRLTASFLLKLVSQYHPFRRSDR